MKKKGSKALLIIGLIVGLGSPLFVILLVLFFPGIPNEAYFPLTIFFYGLGVVLLAFSLAKRRIDKGETRTHNLLRALTPAQIALILSVILLLIQVILAEFLDRFPTGIDAFVLLGLLIIMGFIASIALAAVRWATHQKKSRAALSASGDSPIEYCERCGAATYKGTLKKQNGYILCDSCAKIIEAEEDFEILNSKRKCCVCRKEFDRNRMILVDDQYFCDSCFRSRYADSAVAENDVMFSMLLNK